MSPESKKLFNIVILGVAFMFMFTAFQTCGNVALGNYLRRVLCVQFDHSIRGRHRRTSDLYVCQRPVLQHVHCRFYPAFPMVLLHGVCFHWNRGCCLFFGNLYIYFAWQGKTQISENDRRTVFIALTVISLVGTVLFFLIRKPDPENVFGEEESCDDQDMEAPESAQNNVTKAVDAFKKSLKLCVTKEMLLLSITTAYTGLELTFFSGVYGTCIGAVNKFGTEEKSLIGLSGIFIGIGEILGGSLFGLLSKNNRFGRNPVVLLGTLVHFVAFYLIFLNMPADAPIAPVEGTDSSAYITPSKEVAILCSFLLGLGDSCFNTQLLSILGFLYSEDSAPAFAVFKFVQSICAAVAFFYSNYLLLHWQLLVMVIFGFCGAISFFTVEWDAAAIVARGSDYRSI
ncbi:UNC93-like protein MFSD11 isoform X6 [Arvicola amphibius]|uniref:UNC93-like protein MFSD11 isoform X6 n=2 Tax=Arvicola amphibius TaxID=1047088 RepID=UPI0018E2DCF3|nr:UNC93-like protein MFSD11 isoform X6 [Arvicola amphibius]